jgi:hypothetical protein
MMMKKLLILLLVLGLGTAANAQIEPQLSIYVDGADPGAEYDMLVGSIVEIGIYSDGVGGVNGKYSGALVINAGGTDTGTAAFVCDPPTVYDGVGEPLENLGGAFAVNDGGVVLAFVATNAVLADSAGEGIGFGCDLECTGLGDVTLTIFDDVFGPVDTLTIHQVVPEPITFGLLGLGGLFLRRRK